MVQRLHDTSHPSLLLLTARPLTGNVDLLGQTYRAVVAASGASTLARLRLLVCTST